MTQSANRTDGWIEAYEQNPTGSLWQEDPIPVLSETVPSLRSRKARTVLDVGCGDGRNLAELARHSFVCMGLDLSPIALSRAQAMLEAQGQSAFYLPGSCENIPLNSGSLDALTCFDVFGQLPSPERFLSEAKRVLTPGGALYINAFTTGDSEFGKGEEIAPRQFDYKGTLFRFFEERELRELLDGWEIVIFGKRTWDDPPHGTFRPYPHRHENWYVEATLPS